MNEAIVVIVSTITLLSFMKGYYAGLLSALFFLFLLPYNIFIRTPGSFPNFTIHRIIIIILIVAFFLKPGDSDDEERDDIPIPYFKAFLGVVISSLVSSVFSLVPVDSFKSSLSLIIEQLIFFCVIFKSIAVLDAEAFLDFRKKLSFTIIFSLTLVALIGILERWTSFNVIRFFNLPSHVSAPGFLASGLHQYSSSRISSTYPHPILLGYALTMSWPFIMAMIEEVENLFVKCTLFVSLIATGACIFFTESRGPWIGSIIAGGFMFMTATVKIKRLLIVTCLLLLVAFAVRPQVLNTISYLARDTMNVNTFKGRSYNYRLELFFKAYHEISKSLGRFLIGYGDHSQTKVDWSGYERKTQKFSYFWSWDNEYAATLLGRGVLGVICFLVLYATILLKSFGMLLRTEGDDRHFAAACCATVVVYLFMMTNVAVFSPQIIFLFWTVVAFLANFGDEETGFENA